MKAETRQKLFNYFQQEHNISLMGSDFNELEAIAADEAEKTVIKAKALRKNGTDEGYFYDNKYGWLTSSQLTTFSLFKDDLVYYEYSNCWVKIPTDAGLIDIEIHYQPKQDKL